MEDKPKPTKKKTKAKKTGCSECQVFTISELNEILNRPYRIGKK